MKEERGRKHTVHATWEHRKGVEVVEVVEVVGVERVKRAEGMKRGRNWMRVCGGGSRFMAARRILGAREEVSLGGIGRPCHCLPCIDNLRLKKKSTTTESGGWPAAMRCKGECQFQVDLQYGPLLFPIVPWLCWAGISSVHIQDNCRSSKPVLQSVLQPPSIRSATCPSLLLSVPADDNDLQR
jgi:hypothetical protein